MQEFTKEVKILIKNAIEQCRSDWIAFSGGLDSSILAVSQNKDRSNAISIITKNFIGSDLVYSQIAAKHIGIHQEIKYAEMGSILNAIEKTVKILENFNDIEIRNSIVAYLYLEYLKEKGIKQIITGDGADELFAGYNFLLKKNYNELKTELKRIREIMHFPSKKIASYLNMSIETPFLDPNILEFTESLPMESLIGQKDGITYGKLILRKAFENYLPPNIVWREKTPMQDGSGTSSLTKLFDSVITDETFTEKTMKILDEDGIIIRTKESLHYYELYRQNFSITKPTTENICPDCHSDISKNSKFCKMCGKFPLTS